MSITQLFSLSSNLNYPRQRVVHLRENSSKDLSPPAGRPNPTDRPPDPLLSWSFSISIYSMKWIKNMVDNNILLFSILRSPFSFSFSIVIPPFIFSPLRIPIFTLHQIHLHLSDSRSLHCTPKSSIWTWRYRSLMNTFILITRYTDYNEYECG